MSGLIRLQIERIKQFQLHARLYWLLLGIALAFISGCYENKEKKEENRLRSEYKISYATENYSRLTIRWRDLPGVISERLRMVHIKVDKPTRSDLIWRSGFEKQLDQNKIQVTDLIISESVRYEGVIEVRENDEHYVEYFKQKIDDPLSFDNLVGRCVYITKDENTICKLSKFMYGRWVEVSFVDEYIREFDPLMKQVDDIVKDFTGR